MNGLTNYGTKRNKLLKHTKMNREKKKTPNGYVLCDDIYISLLTAVFLPGKFHGQRGQATVHQVTKSWPRQSIYISLNVKT